MHEDRISEAHFLQNEFAVNHPSQWGLVSAYGFQEYNNANIVKLNSQFRRKGS